MNASDEPDINAFAPPTTLGTGTGLISASVMSAVAYMAAFCGLMVFCAV